MEVWYHSNAQDKAILDGAKGWPHAPRLLEDVYNFEDVLQVACILNTFIRKSNVVKIACIAQLVNVIAPIMTDPIGAAWRQTIYYPYYFAYNYGQGVALRLAVKSPTYDAEGTQNVPSIDITGVQDGAYLTFFAVNRHGTDVLPLEIALAAFGAGVLVEHQVMTSDSLTAVNTAGDPMAVAPHAGSGVVITDGILRTNLPPLSYQMLRVKIA